MYEGEITVSDVNALPDGIVISVKFDDRVEHRPADMLFKVQDEKGKKTAEEIRRQDRLRLRARLKSLDVYHSPFYSVSDRQQAWFEDVTILKVVSGQGNQEK